ncbi:MAG: hypothetical protein PHO48_00065 [Candidatus Gracilibacteria bacterium]|nr:hypothetical protein [Candidatus Gracilibacteria bacterium]MDD5178664.1 hypothetical protein [Candidatus Gracilibacteria bacterium]
MGKIPFYNGFAGRDSGFAEKRRVFSHAPDPHTAPAEAEEENHAEATPPPPPPLEENNSISAQEKRQILAAVEKQRKEGLNIKTSTDISNTIRNAFAARDDLKQRLQEVDKKIAGSKNADIAAKWKALKAEGAGQLKAKEEALDELKKEWLPLRVEARVNLKNTIEGKNADIPKRYKAAKEETQAEAEEMEIEFRMSEKSLKGNSEIKWVFDENNWGATNQKLLEDIKKAKDRDDTAKAKALVKRLKQHLILESLLKPSDVRDIQSGGELSPEIRVLLYHLQQDAFVDGLVTITADNVAELLESTDPEKGIFDAKGNLKLKSEGALVTEAFTKLLDQVTGNPELAKKAEEAAEVKSKAAEKVKKLEEELNSKEIGKRKESQNLKKEKNKIQTEIEVADEKIQVLEKIATKKVELAGAKKKAEAAAEEKSELDERLTTIKSTTALETAFEMNKKAKEVRNAKAEAEAQVTGISTEIENLSKSVIKYLQDKDIIPKTFTAVDLDTIADEAAAKLKEMKANKGLELEEKNREVSESKETVEEKEAKLKEAKLKLKEAEEAEEAAQKELKEWKEANVDTVESRKLSPEEIARIGQAQIFEKDGLGKDIAEHAARLRVNMDILAAREGEATQRNLEFLEGVAQDKQISNSKMHKVKNFLSLGFLDATDDFKSPMRGKKLIENIAKEFKQENHLKINLDPRGLAKLKLSEEQLVLLFGACTHAIKTEKLDVGDRVALSRLADNAKRLILQKRIGTERENESIEKIDTDDYMRLTKDAEGGWMNKGLGYLKKPFGGSKKFLGEAKHISDNVTYRIAKGVHSGLFGKKSKAH